MMKMPTFAPVHDSRMLPSPSQPRKRHILLNVILLLTGLHSSPTLAENGKLLVGISPAVPAPFMHQEPVQETPGFRKKHKPEETPNRPKLPGRVQVWSDAVAHLGEKAGLDMEADLPQSQLVFERKLANGQYDFAYISPMQFISAREFPGYTAIAKRKAEPLRSVIVVKKFSPFKTFAELRDLKIGFSHPLDYTGSIIPRDSLQRANFSVQGSFLPNQQQVLNAVLTGKIDAGAVGSEAWDATGPEFSQSLRVIWDSPGYTPFAFVAHPRLPFYSTTKMQRALVGMIKHEDGQALLEFMHVRNGFESATNSDWHDAQNIDLDKLNQLTPRTNEQP